MKKLTLSSLSFLCLLMIAFLCVGSGKEQAIIVPRESRGNATQSPDRNIGEIFGPTNQLCSGVNIHFVKGHEKDLDMIAAAGITFIRTDMVWQTIEHERGIYDWTAYDELTANLDKRGLRALYIFDYSNSLYEDTVASIDPITGEEQEDIAAPCHEESIAAYVRWATAAAWRYRDRNVVWEIWNEPNISFWRPAADVKQYIILASRTCASIRSAVPGSVLTGPATSQIPFPFLESFLASGILKQLDAVSIHPYRDYSLSPETAAADYRKLKSFIKLYAPPEKRNIPIISSEWGYASCPGGLTTEKQAAMAVRMQMANLLNGIPLSVWYDWKNDGDSPTNFEHNCGTVTSSLTPKPAYNAIKTMNDQLKGFTLLRRIMLEDENDYALLFRNTRGTYKISTWTMGKPHTVNMDILIPHLTGFKAVDGYGNDLRITTDSGKPAPELAELPQYITLPSGIKLN